MDNSVKTIEVKHLVKQFGTFKAVNDISFEVSKGEIFGFLGANGAGKTTAIKMLCGLSKPSGGEAIVAGYNVAKQAEQVKKRIGYMSQLFSLYDDLTVWENIQLFAGIYGLSKADTERKGKAMLDYLNFASQRDSLVSDIPLGWRQKLAFMVATIQDPEIIFLDEPTSGVDPVTRRQFWELIYDAVDRGTTILVTTHFMDEAEYCNRVSIMVDGQIRALGSVKELEKQFDAPTMADVFRKVASTATRQ